MTDAPDYTCMRCKADLVLTSPWQRFASQTVWEADAECSRPTCRKRQQIWVRMYASIISPVQIMPPPLALLDARCFCGLVFAAAAEPRVDQQQRWKIISIERGKGLHTWTTRAHCTVHGNVTVRCVEREHGRAQRHVVIDMVGGVEIPEAKRVLL